MTRRELSPRSVQDHVSSLLSRVERAERRNMGGSGGGAGRLVFFHEKLKMEKSGGSWRGSLTYVPMAHSEHLYWHGVEQPQSEWQRGAGRTITIPDPDGVMRATDEIWVEYAYLDTEQPVSSAFLGLETTAGGPNNNSYGAYSQAVGPLNMLSDDDPATYIRLVGSYGSPYGSNVSYASRVVKTGGNVVWVANGTEVYIWVKGTFSNNDTPGASLTYNAINAGTPHPSTPPQDAQKRPDGWHRFRIRYTPPTSGYQTTEEGFFTGMVNALNTGSATVYAYLGNPGPLGIGTPNTLRTWDITEAKIEFYYPDGAPLA